MIERMVHITSDRASFAQRLIQAADNAGLPARGRGAKIAQTLSVTPKAVSKWFNSESVPSRDKMVELANMLNVSVSWLQYGESGELEHVAPSQTRIIPLISYVQAGNWMDLDTITAVDGGVEYVSVSVDSHLGPMAFALRVKGESMLPDIRPGDIVIVDPNTTARPGEFVVAQNGDGETTIKQYRPRGINNNGKEWFELTPLNEVYPTLRSDLQNITIIGVVVEHRRNTRRTL